jgi:hypothetical protein
MARACRGTSPGLSADVRSRIIDEALSHAPAEKALPSLFTPGRRLLVAGALPVVLAAALLMGIDGDVRAPVSTGEGSSVVSVVKEGDQVTFSISNGGRQHTVYRSTDPVQFEPSSGVAVTDGAYVDRVSDDADLVFYRIE